MSRRTKRICLFAGYDKTGTISEYVIYYLEKLSQFADIYYLADCEMQNGELEKISPHVKQAFAYRHKKYDFGSWQELINQLGYDTLGVYDELLLVNDSCFAPLFPFENIFSKAANDETWDFYGMTEGWITAKDGDSFQMPHLQSYFIVLKNRTFMSDTFKKFIAGINEESSKDAVIEKYEHELTYSLVNAGFNAKKYVCKPLRPHQNWKALIKVGLPFFKTSTMKDLPKRYTGECPTGWKEFLQSATNYDTEMITAHYEKMGIDYQYVESHSFKMKECKKQFDNIRKWFFQLHFTKRNKILRIFGIYFIKQISKQDDNSKPLGISLPCIGLPINNHVRRLCLFAGYDKNGDIADYVLYYIKSLSELSEVYYMADCEMKANELAKLAPYVKEAYGVRHKKYDFGSWQELIKIIGWDKIAEYDELILCNDSCFGPVYPLQPIFAKASADRECDFWAMTDGWIYANDEYGTINLKHLQSYFMVLNRTVVTSEVFRSFINSIQILESKDKIVRKYEVALTGLLRKSGFIPKKFAPVPNEPYNDWKTLVKSGVPFIKTRVFIDAYDYKYKETLTDWDKFIKKISNYDPEMIRTYLKDVNFEYFSSFSYRFIHYLRIFKNTRKWLLQIRFNKKSKTVRIFGKYFINTKPKSIESL